MKDRRTDIQRDSRPASHELFADPQQKADLEARNGLLQFDHVISLIETASSGFKLKPSALQRLQRLAIQDIYTCAGNFRTHPVFIQGTSHQPPPASEVAEHVEELCDYVNEHWHKSPLHLAAYVMWKLNWIHPFAGGNGRTSRAASYLVMCARLGYRVQGSPTIPELIVQNRAPYYEALDAADAAWLGSKIDVSIMENLLGDLLAQQLSSVLRDASSE